MAELQDWIHKFETGSGRYLKYIVAVLGLLVLFFVCNWRGYRNFASQEAMDSAQLARNIAEGKGYTTLFVRPFSMYLVKKKTEDKLGVAPLGKITDYAKIKEAHPDIANPPVYPVILAGLMKVLPFNYTVLAATPKSFWNSGSTFWYYQPDYLIALFNEFLFMCVIVSAFFLARRLFDSSVAWISAIILLGTDLLWRFNVSGLSTMLLLLIFMGLLWCLTLLESETREPKGGTKKVFLLAAATGVLIGIGGLTRYAFGWMIVPVLVYSSLFFGTRRILLGLTVLGAFLVILMPWVARNYHVSGEPFGTATYSLIDNSPLFPRDTLERSLEPQMIGLYPKLFWQKVMPGLRGIAQNEALKLGGGGWIIAFFVVGLMVSFRNPEIRRLRYFFLLSFAILVVVQSAGRTHLSDDSPEINSENLLVLLVPLVIMFGVSLFFILLDQISLPFRELRYVIIGGFSVVMCLPLIVGCFSPKSGPIAFPPYFPPYIQQTSNWMGKDELLMSDMPWAVAWYGNRQCLWITGMMKPDFETLNDLGPKPIHGLYFTGRTLGNHSFADWVKASPNSWENFIWRAATRGEMPALFPLREAPAQYFPEHLFLTDRKRWAEEAK